MVRVGAGTSWVVGVVARAVPPQLPSETPLCGGCVCVRGVASSALFSESPPFLHLFVFPALLFVFLSVFSSRDVVCVGDVCVCMVGCAGDHGCSPQPYA